MRVPEHDEWVYQEAPQLECYVEENEVIGVLYGPKGNVLFALQSKPAVFGYARWAEEQNKS